MKILDRVLEYFKTGMYICLISSILKSRPYIVTKYSIKGFLVSILIDFAFWIIIGICFEMLVKKLVKITYQISGEELNE
ncbi:hypothetical protein EJM73_19625 [Clostridium botulinum]|uniref:hypothetical protein n=1 Tax=Clostridium botulinum TaxID=1491 RepID=UPI0013761823|nr:hypothetical protein [Clostridium botulinum]NCI22137.1 hypothetical protein [Clostridium botulinum]NCI37823.1 hypothetical protein [Clostridium botulinum]NCI74469.1 hypothetical protein [Clostridium botulinum]NDI40944.1 hypothetical protein [Clostridium botulinum]NFA13566.1 hypothetical protein [Clostridium botulinum]